MITQVRWKDCKRSMTERWTLCTTRITFGTTDNYDPRGRVVSGVPPFLFRNGEVREMATEKQTPGNWAGS